MSAAGNSIGAGRQGPDPERQELGLDRGLSRSQRVSDSAIFREAFEKGRRHVGEYMVMWLRSGEDARLRLGVVASRRSFRRAVDRARAKRLLREAYRLNRHKLRGNFDVVLVARAAMAKKKRQHVEGDLLSLASRAKLLREET